MNPPENCKVLSRVLLRAWKFFFKIIAWPGSREANGAAVPSDVELCYDEQ